MVEVRPTELAGVLEILPRRIGDERGFFSETWSAEGWAAQGITADFVQDNHSRSARGVLRGLHYQLPPAAQAKLVRVTRGAIFDVAVDIRRSSASFGRWVGVRLSASDWNQLLIPEGFAHGFVALEDDTEVQYKVTAPYRPELERSLHHADPDIGIRWPVAPEQVSLSAKDRVAPFLAEAELFQ